MADEPPMFVARAPLVTGVGIPPSAATRKIGLVRVGAKMIVPKVLQLPPRPSSASPNHLHRPTVCAYSFQLAVGEKAHVASAAVPAGEIRPGNEGRGTIVGPGYLRWDASLYKNTHITECVNLQFRAEAFNVLNHTNWNNPASTSLTSRGCNKITTARDPRQLQLALKLIF